MSFSQRNLFNKNENCSETRCRSGTSVTSDDASEAVDRRDSVLVARIGFTTFSFENFFTKIGCLKITKLDLVTWASLQQTWRSVKVGSHRAWQVQAHSRTSNLYNTQKDPSQVGDANFFTGFQGFYIVNEFIQYGKQLDGPIATQS